jgi:hypothetical protein
MGCYTVKTGGGLPNEHVTKTGLAAPVLGRDPHG